MWFALFSIIFYILSLLLIAPFLMNSSEGKLSQSKIPFFLTALTAIVLHAVSTFPLLEDLASGQRFTLMGIASLLRHWRRFQCFSFRQCGLFYR